MKIQKIDHLGLAVKNIEGAKRFWSDVLGLKLEGSETIEDQRVRSTFVLIGDSELELLESTSPDGPIARHLEKRGEGIQHVALRVENLEAALAEMKKKGIPLIDERPRKGTGGSKIAFIHPKAANGVLVELCEKK